MLQYAEYGAYADDSARNDRAQPRKVKVRNFGKLVAEGSDEHSIFAEPNIVHFLPRAEVVQGNSPATLFRTCWVKSSFESFSPWQEADDAIKSWIGLRTGWDGCDGTPPGVAALTAAKAFVRRARHVRVPEGDPYITGDGEIGFQWDVDEEVATVSFLADGRYFAFCPRGTENAVRISGVLTDADDVLDLFEALRAFA